MVRLLNRFKRSVRRAVFSLLLTVAATLATTTLFFNLVPTTVPKSLLNWLGAATLFALLVQFILKFKGKTGKYIDSQGYVVLAQENELEHRSIASRLMGRTLYPNEVVHHINGIKTNNEIENLCLMDRKQHELFHSWLRWKKEKNGRYPLISEQKKILVKQFNGLLLASASVRTHSPYRRPSNGFKFRIDQRIPASSKPLHTDDSDKLFQHLRRARKRLADERNLPAYEIFHNSSLHEMVHKRPGTFEAMMQITAKQENLRRYGPYFLKVIQSFHSGSSGPDRKTSA